MLVYLIEHSGIHLWRNFGRTAITPASPLQNDIYKTMYKLHHWVFRVHGLDRIAQDKNLTRARWGNFSQRLGVLPGLGYDYLYLLEKTNTDNQ